MDDVTPSTRVWGWRSSTTAATTASDTEALTAGAEGGEVNRTREPYRPRGWWLRQNGPGCAEQRLCTFARS